MTPRMTNPDLEHFTLEPVAQPLSSLLNASYSMSLLAPVWLVGNQTSPDLM